MIVLKCNWYWFCRALTNKYNLEYKKKIDLCRYVINTGSAVARHSCTELEVSRSKVPQRPPGADTLFLNL